MNNIKTYRNWLVWKIKSEPTSALTGRRTGWQNNLATYAEAEQYCKDNDGFQLGVCFTPDFPYIGIDIDGCKNPQTGALSDWAIPFLDIFPGAWENLSVSGTGIKLVVPCDRDLKRGVKIIDAKGFGDHTPQVELFTSSKYFALTVSEVVGLQVDTDYHGLGMLCTLMGYDIFETSQPTTPKSGGDTSSHEIAGLLEKLDVMDYTHRDDWIRIMASCHHATGGSELCRIVFDMWSEGDSDSYDTHALQRDWDSMDPNPSNPITIATLIAEIAPEDRPQITPAQDFAGVAVAEVVRSAGTGMVPDLISPNNRNHSFVANMFASESNETVRYLPEWKSWICYDGQRWIQDPEGLLAQNSLSKWSRNLMSRVPDDPDNSEECAKAVAWVSQLGNWNSTNGVLKLAKSQIDFRISLEDMAIKPHLLNMQNGTFNLETMKLQPHDPADLLFGICSCEYVQDKDCPLWRRVINDIFDGDAELVSWVQKLFGYSISGTTELEIFPVAYGDGCNGKSTVVQTILRLLGEYSTTIPSELFSKKDSLHPTYVAQLCGKRFASIAELESDVDLSEAMVKKITSQDQIEARRMREDPWPFTPSHTTLLCTNHKPRVKGSDKGIWRRIKLIPFTVDLTDSKDESIPDQLQLEYSGIMNWLLEGYKLYKDGGLGECEAVEAATGEYKLDEDDFQSFIEEFLTPSEGESVKQRAVYEVYQLNGGRMGPKNFNKAMRGHGYPVVRREKAGRKIPTFDNIILEGKGV